jgi:hypothetical protein
MNKQPDNVKKVDATLESLDGIQRAEPQPFFYTRLKGRLQRDEKNSWEKIGSFLSRPVVVIASLCIILVFNVVIVYKQNTEVPQAHFVQTQEPVIITDNEYILASGSSFDYENVDQQ